MVSCRGGIGLPFLKIHYRVDQLKNRPILEQLIPACLFRVRFTSFPNELAKTRAIIVLAVALFSHVVLHVPIK
jgi:hypothetical protein